MKKNMDLLQAAMIVLIVLLAAVTGMTASYDMKLFWVELPFALAEVVFGIIRFAFA